MGQFAFQPKSKDGCQTGKVTAGDLPHHVAFHFNAQDSSFI